MPQALPANPDLDWLRKAAKKRLAELRVRAPETRLHLAQLAVANDYGFRSWRALKAHLDEINRAASGHERVFAAARDGDVGARRRAFASGFDPATQDGDGRTVYQIAKELRHGALEILARDIQGGRLYPEAEQEKVQAIVSAAQSGDISALRARLDAFPELIDALGGR